MQQIYDIVLTGGVIFGIGIIILGLISSMRD